MNNLPDIQENTEPEIKTFINCVGIENVKVPVHFIENHNNYKTFASVSMYTELDKNIRAISLSEFLRYYSEYKDKPIIIPDDIKELLKNFHKISRMGNYTSNIISNIKFKFDYKKEILSPVSGNSFPQFYPCFIHFELCDDFLTIYRGVTVQYASYCPCSKALCDNVGKGIPHAQRSYCDLIIETTYPSITFDKLISTIEGCVINKTYPIIRRVDEQNLAVKASDNTYFIEDLIRRIKNEIDGIDEIDDWFIRLRHEESIHTHNVIAMAWSTWFGLDNKFLL